MAIFVFAFLASQLLSADSLYTYEPQFGPNSDHSFFDRNDGSTSQSNDASEPNENIHILQLDVMDVSQYPECYDTCLSLFETCVPNDGVSGLGRCVPYSDSENFNSACFIDALKKFLPTQKSSEGVFEKMVEGCKGIEINPKSAPCGFLRNYIPADQNPLVVDQDMVLNNPYPDATITADMMFGAEGASDPFGPGSAGFGLWDLNVGISGMNFAWFMNQKSKTKVWRDSRVAPPDDGFYAVVKTAMPSNATNPQDYFAFKKLVAPDDQFHQYQVDWQKDYIKFYIDGELVFFVVDINSKPKLRGNGTMPDATIYIPKSTMAVHNWIDNASYKAGLLAELTMAPIENRARIYRKNLTIKTTAAPCLN